MRVVKLCLSREQHKAFSKPDIRDSLKEGTLFRTIFCEFNKDSQELELLLEDVGTLHNNVRVNTPLEVNIV